MKALVVSTIGRFIWQFGESNVKVLQEMGFEVHIAANFKEELSDVEDETLIKHQIDFSRNPFSRSTLEAYRQLDRLLSEETFDIIHCQTPIASCIARRAAAAHHVAPVIYMAHGFHFYEGASFKARLIYKGAEKKAAAWTDGLITINEEDYRAAQQFKLKRNGKVYKVPGVGVPSIETAHIPVSPVRGEFNIPKEDYLIVSFGELNYNKNQSQVIRAIALLPEEMRSHIHYLVCGIGYNDEKLAGLAQEKGVQLYLPGFRTDVYGILKAADLFAMPSYREGLSKAMMEAMSFGVPIIASRIRGNVDLIEDGKNGLLFPCNDDMRTAQCIRYMFEHREEAQQMGKRSLGLVGQYEMSQVKARMWEIYAEQLERAGKHLPAKAPVLAPAGPEEKTINTNQLAATVK